MDWQHPFITIDQNQLRQPDAIGRVLEDCHRNDWNILIPDGAFLELSKSGRTLDTARRSLQLLAPHRELVCSSRKLADMMREEMLRKKPCASLVEDDASRFLRTILFELDSSKDGTLRELVDGPVARLMPTALEVWNNHAENKRHLQSLHDALAANMSAGELKRLRRSPAHATGDWLAAHSARFVFQGLKARGLDDDTAFELTRMPSVSAGFLSAMAGVAVDWIAFGGLATTAATESSTDLNDIEYVVLGALSRSLETRDQRASRVCQAVALAFESRRRAIVA